MPALSVILPCYNEGKNLPGLLERFRKYYPEYDYELILVNNGSTDDTEKYLRQELAKEENRFVRTVKVDVNTGYGNGIKQGLKAACSSVLCFTHADHQTPPDDVFRAFDLIRERGVDIECSLIKGRRTGRSEKALMFTRGLSRFARFVLGQEMEDINAQPKMFSKSFFESLQHAPDDFTFDTYILYAARLKGLNFIDFPVDFRDRLHGESKWAFSLKGKIRAVCAYMMSILKIARNHYHDAGNVLRQIVRFLISGVMTNAGHFCVFLLVYSLFKLHYLLASTLGFFTGFLIGFVMNRKWTFPESGGSHGASMLRYLLLNLVSLSANLLTMLALTGSLGWNAVLSQVIAIGISTVINFFGSKYWVFKG